MLQGDCARWMMCGAVANNLSLQLTSFVGRERQIAELEQLLHSVRLLTLVGAGGVGKTRLAQRVVSDAIADTPDGVWLVELARLTDADLVVQTVAATLTINERPGEPLERSLQISLADRALLLVLDNCEHLVAACAALVDGLLRSCPRLRVIATSREPLGVVGETTWRVPSLQVPDVHSATSADEISASEAVRLFVDRARSALPGFAVTDRNARSIAQICTQLDGIPLALELAAARISTLGVEQLVSRLDDRFRLLVRSGQSGPGVLERHRTLRATLEWSHDLLSEVERRLLRRLSVFAGGWTLEAAEAVCADSETLPRADILDLLSRLADRSMVLVEDQDSSARAMDSWKLCVNTRMNAWSSRAKSKHYASATAIAVWHSPSAPTRTSVDLSRRTGSACWSASRIMSDSRWGGRSRPGQQTWPRRSPPRWPTSGRFAGICIAPRRAIG
jgi:predicted ATPase